MGEQSVGKSFALNHLVDTSFAGSAMRTTEGVWMSVTPTKDALIVALDFEGLSRTTSRSVSFRDPLLFFGRCTQYRKVCSGGHITRSVQHRYLQLGKSNEVAWTGRR